MASLALDGSDRWRDFVSPGAVPPRSLRVMEQAKTFHGTSARPPLPRRQAARAAGFEVLADAVSPDAQGVGAQPQLPRQALAAADVVVSLVIVEDQPALV